MKCKSCQHEIKKSVNFCENCGSTTSEINTDLDFELGKEEKKQKLIFKGLLILCSFEIYHFLLDKIAQSTGSFSLYSTLGPISFVVGILAAGAALLIAFGLDMGRRKVLAIFLASMYAVINLFWITDLLFAK